MNCHPIPNHFPQPTTPIPIASQSPSYRSNEPPQSSQPIPNYQHDNMLQQDYQALLYRKLNHIIELQQLQQSYSNREEEFTTLDVFGEMDRGQIGLKMRREVELSPVISLVNQMVKYHRQLRKQFQLRKTIAEIQVQIGRLGVQKKTLLKEIQIFVQKLLQQAEEGLQGKECKVLESILQYHGQKYCLSTVVSNFISQIRQVMVGSFVSDSLNALLKKANSQESKQSLKFQQLKLPLSHQKNKKQLVCNFTQYLKQFHSRIIFQQFSQIIQKLIVSYQQNKAYSNYLFQQMLKQIQANIKMLYKIGKDIGHRNGAVMDCKIDLQIISKDNVSAENNIYVYQQELSQFIKDEAVALMRQYGQTETDTLSQNALTDNFNYFHSKLAEKYRQFIISHLKQAEQIQTLKQRIVHHNVLLASYQNMFKYKMMGSGRESELQTHRTMNYQQLGQENGKIGQRALLEISFEHNLRSNYDWDQKQHLIQNKQEGNNHLAMTEKFTSLLVQFQKKDRFIVTKLLTIGISHKNLGPNTPSFRNGQQSKQFQLQITKKFIILQPICQNQLTFKQKIQISHIKHYECDKQNYILNVDYGGCKLRLKFITDNIECFYSKLQKTIKTVGRTSIREYRSFK